jgi:phosphatidate phosphatase APP1
VAGTVFPNATAPASAGIAGVSVVVTDANNTKITLTSNVAGNFYTRQSLALPLQSVYLVRNGTRTEMGSAPNGSCASSACHKLGSSLGAVYAN